VTISNHRRGGGGKHNGEVNNATAHVVRQRCRVRGGGCQGREQRWGEGGNDRSIAGARQI
jgi:hypothetical protein